MYRDLPPIHLLIAFEAAAQQHSFKLAAQVLCITPSAVSQQIKQLEQHLNMTLFKRLTRRVELSEYGKAYLRVAEQTLTTYRNCHDSFLYQVSNPILRISMIPFGQLYRQVKTGKVGHTKQCCHDQVIYMGANKVVRHRENFLQKGNFAIHNKCR